MVIKAKNITKIYKTALKERVVALKDISFEVEKGEFVFVVGRSGAGKTTLLKIISSFEMPSAGEIFVLEQNLLKVPKNKIYKIRQKIGVVFQDYKLLDDKTVFENIAFALDILGQEKKEIEENTFNSLELVDMLDKQNKFPYELSEGEKQRVALARALAKKPEILIADEPTGNLDPYNARMVVNILKKVNSLGTTILVATHNREVLEYANDKKRILSLDSGKLVLDSKEGKFIL